MTDLLQNTVSNGGTLANPSNWGAKFRYTDAKGKRYTIPAGGKTGTTQNWADAWTAGFTPYYTSVFWFGFDKPGQSLGLKLTGSTLAGYAWSDFMSKANDGLPYKEFERPATGLIQATVCSVSGGILTPDCGDHKITAWYLEGTQPTEVCTVHSNSTSVRTLALYRLEREMYKAGFASEMMIRDSEPLRFDLSLVSGGAQTGFSSDYTTPNELQLDENGVAPDYNFLLD